MNSNKYIPAYFAFCLAGAFSLVFELGFIEGVFVLGGAYFFLVKVIKLNNYL